MLLENPHPAGPRSEGFRAAGGRRREPALCRELPVENEDTMVPAVGHGAPRSKTVHGNPVSSPRNHAEQQEVILLDDLDIPKLHGVRPLHDASMPPHHGSDGTQPGAARAAQWYAQGGAIRVRIRELLASLHPVSTARRLPRVSARQGPR